MDGLLDDVTSLVGFFLYLNQMSHMTMFLTSHMRKKKTRSQKKFQYISLPYVHVLVTLSVPLRLLQLVDLQELVSPYSYKRPFQLVFFVFLLLLVISYNARLLSNILLGVEYLHLVPSLYYYNTISLPILTYPRLSYALQQKPMDVYFCQGEMEEPVYDRLFSYRPLLKNHSNQEHDHANLHPPDPDIIEQLVENNSLCYCVKTVRLGVLTSRIFVSG